MSPSTGDRLLILFSKAAAFSSLSILAGIFIFITIEALPALQQLGLVSFLSFDSWNPEAHHWGLWPLLITSITLTCGALFISAPVGLCLAVFHLAFQHRIFNRLLKTMLDLAAGTPSVVYGFWGMTALVPALAKWSSTGQGQGVFAGMLLLALMLIPISYVSSYNALSSVSSQHQLAGHALGMTPTSIWYKIILPDAKSGLITSILLQTTRALGETMAVLMVCGNIIALPFEPFVSVRALTANIARDMGEATDLHRSALFVTGLILMLCISTLISLPLFFRSHRNHASS